MLTNNKKGVDKKEEKKQIEIKVPISSSRTIGQSASDALTTWAGSWTFILLFFAVIGLWIYANVAFLLNLGKTPFDPFPFILLNLALSLLAAIQAPIILMSQNRQTERDRLRFEYDYAVNRKAEREIREIKKLIKSLHKRKR